MKKLFTGILLSFAVFMASLSVGALTYDESYNASRNYFSNKTVLQGADEVFAYEALGLESDSLELEYVVNSDYASSIAKTVIALVLHGDDPRNYDGVNYVEMLEECVKENGAFDKENDATDANYQVYGVYALYVVNSDKKELAADYLVSLANKESGAFGFGTMDDLSVTSWAIEALSLVNKTKYESVIEKAITYIQSKQLPSSGYDGYGYGVDSNTQACVLMGLLTYDKAGVEAGKYNYENGENNPYDFLLTFQNEDGSFGYQTPGEDSYWSTLQGGQTVGYYYNGSVYQKAFNTYQNLINEDNKQEPEEPVEPSTPEQIPETPLQDPIEENNVPKTADTTNVLVLLSLCLLSGVSILKGRKNFE